MARSNDRNKDYQRLQKLVSFYERLFQTNFCKKHDVRKESCNQIRCRICELIEADERTAKLAAALHKLIVRGISAEKRTGGRARQFSPRRTRTGKS